MSKPKRQKLITECISYYCHTTSSTDDEETNLEESNDIMMNLPNQIESGLRQSTLTQFWGGDDVNVNETDGGVAEVLPSSGTHCDMNDSKSESSSSSDDSSDSGSIASQSIGDAAREDEILERFHEEFYKQSIESDEEVSSQIAYFPGDEPEE